ncbi:hypothetical protein NEPAR06_0607 [Nematocida parisii]|uniref:Uncharacterized protein n=1 Tax=Nematocida parisii (strain ERTm3) TaxID=935791 RepID=I3EEU7_NEMP3|nr:uncharacterized protein NEPG_01925 [Nematocida parisii ERTm1]EIJ87744.1 hypothetical protein NEQG_01816 [Nematocida parisii ERTm3]KAI5143509.1 hypothetical protein NEPAR07_0638 [Nematocida parisii]EIJ92970.1 hypothetical protein NEPG_01925 [Nematocida parisii ERTm1]KAI5153628.1 hypothetical protein NEPAR06_0607 [Nematocida parisii]KAI5156531.1 hypothetical protein NEPAR05_0646 [Nematocida parisii]|eukprot:XP_013059753.1 hypothetical protein NEPG_01925 [Nematocida parisii ERTm1]
MERMNAKRRIIHFTQETILKKIWAIMALMTMTHTVYAWLSSNEEQEIQKMRFGDSNQLIMHPKGIFSSFCKYAMENSKFMHNLRNYSYVIERSESNENGGRNTIRRDLDNYLQEFAQQMINMFPSEDGKLSIDSKGSDAFIKFMENYKDSSDSLYVLAALYLLSEKINIPIEIVGDEKSGMNLTLKKKNKNSLHISLSMTIYKNTNEGVYQKQTEKIINFFKSTADPSSHITVPAKFSMPSTYQEFLTGDFLFNPRFLIQSYIYKYIDTKEKYSQFMMAVYTLLCENMPSENQAPTSEIERHAQRVCESLFINESSDTMKNSLDCITNLCAIKDMDAIKNWALAFKGDSLNHLHTRLPIFNRSSDDFNEHALPQCGYDNCIEGFLLGIFLCSTFEQKSQKYKLDHLPNPSKELKDFFCKYNEPTATTEISIHKDWCRVVAGLSDDSNVLYDKLSRNKISPGLLNILYIIKKIAGENDELNRAILCLEEIIIKAKVEESDLKKIQNCMQNVFMSLSYSKNIEVVCDSIALAQIGIKIQRRTDITPDNGHSFLVVYKKGEEDMASTIKIQLSKEKSMPIINWFATEDLNLRIGCAKSPFKKMQIKYAEPETYSEYIIKQYIDIRLYQTVLGIEKINEFTKRIQTTPMPKSNNIAQNPNALLLWGTLENIRYKSCIIEMFLIHTSPNKLDTKNRMVQFTKNLIGSVSLKDLRTKQQILKGFEFNENYKEYYTQYSKQASEIFKSYRTLKGTQILLESLLSVNASPVAIISSFQALTNGLQGSNCGLNFFGSDYVCKNLVKKLSELENDNDIKTNMEVILKSIKKCETTLSKYMPEDIFMAWFIHIGKWEVYHKKSIIKPIYDSIDFKKVDIKNVKSILEIKISTLSYPTMRSIVEKADKLLDDNKTMLVENANIDDKKYSLLKEILQKLLINPLDTAKETTRALPVASLVTG